MKKRKRLVVHDVERHRYLDVVEIIEYVRLSSRPLPPQYFQNGGAVNADEAAAAIREWNAYTASQRSLDWLIRVLRDGHFRVMDR